MNTKNFRIGNFVNETIEITEIDSYGINGYYDEGIGGINYSELGCLKGEIKPIKITEKWLFKFNFKNNDNDFVITNGRQGFIITKTEDNDFILLYREDIGMNYNFLKFIEYVHELQNIFFILTGEEL